MQRPNDLPRDPQAILWDKLDQIIDLLRFSVGMNPVDMRAFEDMLPPTALQEEGNLLLELMVAASLPSAPERVEGYQVGNVEVQLAQNESTPLMRVEVTNDNVAQPLWVAQRGVLFTTGRQIVALQTQAFVIPQGSALFGICAIPFINVRVSIGFDFYQLLDSIKQQRRQQ